MSTDKPGNKPKMLQKDSKVIVPDPSASIYLEKKYSGENSNFVYPTYLVP